MRDIYVFLAIIGTYPYVNPKKYPVESDLKVDATRHTYREERALDPVSGQESSAMEKYDRVLARKNLFLSRDYIY